MDVLPNGFLKCIQLVLSLICFLFQITGVCFTYFDCCNGVLGSLLRSCIINLIRKFRLTINNSQDMCLVY